MELQSAATSLREGWKKEGYHFRGKKNALSSDYGRKKALANLEPKMSSLAEGEGSKTSEKRKGRRRKNTPGGEVLRGESSN